MITLRKIESVHTGDKDKPKLNILIEECGELWVNKIDKKKINIIKKSFVNKYLFL